MRFGVYRGEKNLSELARRLYRVKSGARLAEAEASLLRNNPQLKSLREVPDGAVIAVPDVRNAEPAEAETGSAAFPEVQAMVRTVREALGGIGETLAAGIARERDEAGGTAEFLKTREVRAAGRADRATAGELAAAARRAEERLAGANEDVKLQRQAVRQIERDLDEFMNQMGGG